jgi:hypothetical protein
MMASVLRFVPFSRIFGRHIGKNHRWLQSGLPSGPSIDTFISVAGKGSVLTGQLT